MGSEMARPESFCFCSPLSTLAPRCPPLALKEVSSARLETQETRGCCPLNLVGQIHFLGWQIEEEAYQA